ncbi:uncharacterized protein [Dermacentor albipictus]|uniref:uncharacterized protein isoform X3 n=1 Tax=Dermacentor albipictus TaxID=60249 RepID=UPI0038FC1065
MVSGDDASKLSEGPGLTCVHEPCWRGLVRDPLDGSDFCLACGAHLVLYCSQHWSAPRAAAAVRALASALHDLPHPLPGPLRTAAAPPIWSLVAAALHWIFKSNSSQGAISTSPHHYSGQLIWGPSFIFWPQAFIGRTPDTEAMYAAAHGMCRAVTLLSLSGMPDAPDLFKMTVEDVVDSVCLASSSCPEKTEAQLTVLAVMAGVDSAAVGKAIALRTGEVEAALVRHLASSSSSECTLQHLARLLSRLCEDGISLRKALLPHVLHRSAVVLHLSRSPQLQEELLQDLCQLLPWALASSSPLPSEIDSVSKLLGSLKAVVLQAKQVSLRMAATHCITALVCTPAATLCAQLHLPGQSKLGQARACVTKTYPRLRLSPAWCHMPPVQFLLKKELSWHTTSKKIHWGCSTARARRCGQFSGCNNTGLKMIPVAWSDVLVECLASADALFLESLVKCLCRFSQCPVFYENLLVAYALQPLLMSASQLVTSKRMDAAANALSLLQELLSRQQNFRASHDLVKLFVQHLSDQMATGHQAVVLAALEVFGELCSGFILPTPVPLALLRQHVKVCMDSLSTALASSCGSCSGEAVAAAAGPSVPLSRSQEQDLMEGRVLCAGLHLLLRWAEVHRYMCQDPVANEDSYGLELAPEDRLNWLVCFVVGQLVAVFLPHCQHCQQPRACEKFLECLCMAFCLAEEHSATMALQVLEECHVLLPFLWDIRVHQKELIQLTGVAFAWFLWFAAGDFRDADLLATIQMGCQSLPDSFAECLHLLLQSHRTHSDVQLAVLMLCVLQWEQLLCSQDDSAGPELEEVEPPPLCFATAVANYVLINGYAGCQSLLVLSLLCQMIPSIACSSCGDQNEVKAASQWLLKYLHERGHWKDVLVPEQHVLLWCVSTNYHQELLGNYAFCEWMELLELPEGLEVHLSNSHVALKPLVRLLTSSDEGMAEKAVRFVKALLQKSLATEAVGHRLRTELLCLSVEKFTDIWHQRTAATGKCLWQLLELVVLCRDASLEGLIVVEELKLLFQKVMHLTLESNVSHASTALAYFLFVLKAVDVDRDSAASLLLFSGQWLGWLESQLAAGTPHAWSLLAALACIQEPAKLVSKDTVRIAMRNFLRELGHVDPGRVLPALTLLPALLHGTSVVQMSLRYCDCSSIAYILATHIAKRDTQLRTAALDCLEVLLPHAQLLADDEGCLNCISAHPWLNRVLLLSFSNEDCTRLLYLLLEGEIVSELLASHLPLITERLCQDDSSLARAVAAKLLSGVYSSRLSIEVQGQLRQLLSPSRAITSDSPDASDLTQ